MDTIDHHHSKRIMRLMLSLLFVGLLSAATAAYLLIFTDITTSYGVLGIGLVVGLITLAGMLIVPAKIYIILRYTHATRRQK